MQCLINTDVTCQLYLICAHRSNKKNRRTLKATEILYLLHSSVLQDRALCLLQQPKDCDTKLEAKDTPSELPVTYEDITKHGKGKCAPVYESPRHNSPPLSMGHSELDLDNIPAQPKHDSPVILTRSGFRDRKAYAKATVLRNLVLFAVFGACALILTLAVIIYYVQSRSAGEWGDGPVWPDAVCRAVFGPCYKHLGPSWGKFIRNCSFIYCHAVCFVPDENFRQIVKTVFSQTPIRKLKVRDGTICGPKSTCSHGSCVISAATVFPKQNTQDEDIECINKVSNQKNLCNYHYICFGQRYCQIHNQLKISFAIECKNKSLGSCATTQAVKCDPPCSIQTVSKTTTLWAMEQSKNSSRCELLESGCKYKCKNEATARVPTGAPCTDTDSLWTKPGFCWQGRCTKQRQLDTIRFSQKVADNSCYKRVENAICYNRNGVFCTKSGTYDLYGKTTTRYGDSCQLWDSDEIPKKYRHFKNDKCVIFGTNKIPACYAVARTITWDYCYHDCVSTFLFRKHYPGILRVASFSYSQFAINEIADVGATQFANMRLDVVIIDTWPDEQDHQKAKMKKLLRNLESKTKQEWETCGENSRPGKVRLVVKSSLQSKTIDSLLPLKDTVGCTIYLKSSNQSGVLAIVGTNVNANNQYSAPKLCGIELQRCKKSTVEECEQQRETEVQQLLKALRSSGLKTESTILGGYFSQPSHLDWTKSAKHLQCGVVRNWSISNMIYTAGFKDSFRYKYPDPAEYPGFTWTCNEKWAADALKVRDKYIYFKGKRITPSAAMTYPRVEPMSEAELRKSWPSNAYAVVVDFKYGN